MVKKRFSTVKTAKVCSFSFNSQPISATITKTAVFLVQIIHELTSYN